MRFFSKFFGRLEIPQTVKRILKFIPTAGLSALGAPALCMTDNTLDVSTGNKYVAFRDPDNIQLEYWLS